MEVSIVCKKCPAEDHNGVFCRCEIRNIEVAKALREKGQSPWKANQVHCMEGKCFMKKDLDDQIKEIALTIRPESVRDIYGTFREIHKALILISDYLTKMDGWSLDEN